MNARKKLRSSGTKMTPIFSPKFFWSKIFYVEIFSGIIGRRVARYLRDIEIRVVLKILVVYSGFC